MAQWIANRRNDQDVEYVNLDRFERISVGSWFTDDGKELWSVYLSSFGQMPSRLRMNFEDRELAQSLADGLAHGNIPAQLRLS